MAQVLPGTLPEEGTCLREIELVVLQVLAVALQRPLLSVPVLSVCPPSWPSVHSWIHASARHPLASHPVRRAFPDTAQASLIGMAIQGQMLNFPVRGADWQGSSYGVGSHPTVRRSWIVRRKPTDCPHWPMQIHRMIHGPWETSADSRHYHRHRRPCQLGTGRSVTDVTLLRSHDRPAHLR